MLRLYEFVGPLVFVFWVYCVIEVILTKDEDTRNLPKVAWLLLVLFFPLVGGIAWLSVGRPGTSRRSARYERAAPAFPEYDRPGRAAGVTAESDEEFLRRVRERAEEQRRRAAEQRRRRESQPPADDSGPV